jgi:uncharacterized protein YndB with AHSA1/START domain
MIRAFPVIAAIALAGAASPALADVTQKSDSGFVVRVTAEVAASPAEAWRTFAAPAQWWNGAHTFSGDSLNMTLDPAANGCLCEKLPVPKDGAPGQKPGSVMHMRVVYAEPYRALRMVGGLGPLQSEAVNGTMTVTFSPADGAGGKGTRILWEYVVGGYMRYKVDTIAGAVDKVLAEQITRLMKVLGPLAVAGPSIPSDAMGSESSGAGDTPVTTPTEPDFTADPSRNEAEAGQSVKAALDQLFRKQDKPLPSGR